MVFARRRRCISYLSGSRVPISRSVPLTNRRPAAAATCSAILSISLTLFFLPSPASMSAFAEACASRVPTAVQQLRG